MQLKVVRPGEPIMPVEHPLRADVDAALSALLTPDVTAIMLMVAHRDGPLVLRPVPDIEPLIDGMLDAAYELRRFTEE
jgi:hypothetical protein